jgi:hypothetical protein
MAIVGEKNRKSNFLWININIYFEKIGANKT